LTTGQVVALTIGQIGALTTSQVVSFKVSQVAALTVDQISSFNTSQITAFSANQIGALSGNQITALTLAEVTALTTTQITYLKSSQIAAFTSDQLGALTNAQIAALTIAQIAALTTSQISNLQNTQVAALTTSQIAGLKTSQLGALNYDQIESLTTAQVVALTVSQTSALSTTQIVALTTAQVAALTSTQFPALKTGQIVALSTNQIVAISVNDIAALTGAQVDALTSSQHAALTTSQLAALPIGSPIILDLTGDGITTQSILAGVKFDLFATGQKVDTGWVAGGDGLLALDRNHDGLINDGSELFGTATRLPDGSKAADGYAALRALDLNGDGAINRQDAAYGDLRVWVDTNADGISQAGELHTLAALGIASLQTEAAVTAVKNNGNWVGLTSSYQSTDGSIHDSADVWFVAKATAPAVPTTLAPTQALGAKVNLLVHAIGAFDAPQRAAQSNAPNLLAADNAALASINLAAANVADMVEELKKFDAHGGTLGSTLTTTASGQGLNPPGQQHALLAGVLASHLK
jgi:hypothetical protein